MSKPIVSDTLKTGRERSTEDEVIISINGHLVLKLAKMKKGVGDFRVVIEGGHHKLSQET